MSQTFDGPVTVTGDLIVTGPLGSVLKVMADPNIKPGFVVGAVTAQFLNIHTLGGITCDGPINGPDGLRLTGPHGTLLTIAADPNTKPGFVVEAVTAQFSNIHAFGEINSGAGMNCSTLTCASLAPSAANHVIGLAGGLEISGGLVVGHDLVVDGDIMLSGADCAEDFDVGIEVLADPGTVMVLGEEGALFPCLKAYDKRVAGVVSGAGEFKSSLVLDKRPTDRKRQPLALIGKTCCRVDASTGAIEVGDLLTTSSTPGHAMKAQDGQRAFGAIIGKALRPLGDGLGLIPILVALQ